ncbi:hypothetical protein [Siphonobacter sp.]|uniref:hypothetical protein n=1 Tax=Siphonobacter sp. TaxID=1869184 RepID=UPI003B3A90A6
MDLSELGDRICILGPSNSGKSTLAQAIGQKCNLEVIHLDQFYHWPHTNWQVRPRDEFVALHEAAIAGDRWVIDGNYTVCMPQRFQRAIGLILLEVSTLTSLVRYFYRTLFQSNRPGNLEGGQDSIKWAMIHHILVVTPKNRKRYTQLFNQAELPKIRLTSRREINQCYLDWGLQRPF